MPCTAPVRGKTDQLVQWLDWTDNDPCGKEDYASGLCKLHYQMRNGVGLPSLPAYSLAVMVDIPSGYWRLNEPVGATAVADSSGNGNNGTVIAPVAFGSPGRIPGDTAATPSGTGWVTIPDSSSLDLGDIFTLEGWVKPTSFAGFESMISKGVGAYYLRLEQTTGAVRLLASQTAAICASTVNCPMDGNFHHVAATKQGATIKLYLDGVDVTGAVVDRTCVNNNGALGLGTDVGAGIASLLGSIAHLAVYPTALSAARILAHYQAAG